MPLTDTQVKNALSKDKPYKMPDGHGLVLLVKPMGGKYWQFRYRFNNKEQLISFGTYPDVRLAEAREKCHDARKLLKTGQNPSSLRQEQKLKARLNAASTFEVVAHEWLEQRGGAWSVDHKRKITQRLNKHVFPAFGKQPIDSLKGLFLREFFTRLEATGSTEIVHRVHSYCSQIFEFGLMTQRCFFNPCKPLKGALKAHRAQNYPRIPIKELPAFLARLEEVSTSEQNKLALRFLMLTLVRQGEMRRAKWEDIDWEAKEWLLPAPTTKMKKEHIVPLSLQALEILKSLRDITGHNLYGLLFPTQNRQKNPYMSENTLNMVIKKMGYSGKMVPHGCRGVASTHLHETCKYPSDAIECQLAHKPKDAVKAAYNKAEYLEIRRPMMQYWGDYVEAAGLRAAKVIHHNFNAPAA